MMNEFKTIRQTATSGILPEKELRSRLARGALPHIKIGNRVYVNIPLSDCKSGYFLPTSTLDIQRFIRSMSRRSREIAAISHAAEDALLKMTGQETLRGWQNG